MWKHLNKKIKTVFFSEQLRFSLYALTVAMSSIEFVHNNGGSAPHCNNDLQINHNNGSSTTNGNGNKIESEQVLRGLLMSRSVKLSYEDCIESIKLLPSYPNFPSVRLS